MPTDYGNIYIYFNLIALVLNFLPSSVNVSKK